MVANWLTDADVKPLSLARFVGADADTDVRCDAERVVVRPSRLNTLPRAGDGSGPKNGPAASLPWFIWLTV